MKKKHAVFVWWQFVVIGDICGNIIVKLSLRCSYKQKPGATIRTILKMRVGWIKLHKMIQANSAQLGLVEHGKIMREKPGIPIVPCEYE